MMSNQKKVYVLVMFLGLSIGLTLTNVSGAPDITTDKSEVRALLPLSLSLEGLTASTYYTIYVEDTLLANFSSGSQTTKTVKVSIPTTLVGYWVDITLRDVSGVTTHDTMSCEVVDILPQWLVDVLGGMIPWIFGFAVVGAVFGLPMLYIRKMRVG